MRLLIFQNKADDQPPMSQKVANIDDLYDQLNNFEHFSYHDLFRDQYDIAQLILCLPRVILDYSLHSLG